MDSLRSFASLISLDGGHGPEAAAATFHWLRELAELEFAVDVGARLVQEKGYELHAYIGVETRSTGETDTFKFDRVVGVARAQGQLQVFGRQCRGMSRRRVSTP